MKLIIEIVHGCGNESFHFSLENFVLTVIKRIGVDLKLL